MTSSVVLLGCGKLGNILGIELLKQGFQVYGIRRQIDEIAKGIRPLEANFLPQAAKQVSENKSSHLQKVLEEGCDFLVIALAPKQRSPETYQSCYVDIPQAFLKSLSKKASGRLKRIFLFPVRLFLIVGMRRLLQRTQPLSLSNGMVKHCTRQRNY